MNNENVNGAPQEDDRQTALATLNQAFEGEEIVRPSFVIDTLQKVDWFLRKIRQERQFRQDLKGWKKEEEGKSLNREKALCQFFQPQVEKVFQANRKGKLKSIPLPTGKVGLREVADSFQVEDPKAYEAWVRANVPMAVKTTLTLKGTKLAEALLVVTNSIPGLLSVKTEILHGDVNKHCKKSGELPDGCKIIPRYDKFFMDTPIVEATNEEEEILGEIEEP